MHPSWPDGGALPSGQVGGTPILPVVGAPQHPSLTGFTGLGSGTATPAKKPQSSVGARMALHFSPGDENEVIQECHPEELFSPNRPDPIALFAFRNEGQPLKQELRQILRGAIRQYAHSDPAPAGGPRKHMLNSVLGSFGEFAVFRDA